MPEKDPYEYPRTASEAPIQADLRDSLPVQSPSSHFISSGAKMLDRNYKIAAAKRE